MYFSKVDFTGRTPKVEWLIEDLYQTHRSLWRLFKGGAQKREFLFREVPGRSTPSFYVLSRQKPANGDKFWKTEVKNYNPQIAAQQRFHFSLRVNPTITKTKEGKKSRHDVVMHDKRERKRKGTTAARDPLFESGLKWLESRAATNGFKIFPDKLRVSNYSQHSFARKVKNNDFSRHSERKNSGERLEMKLSSLDFEGILEVSDAELFQKCLFNGLGPGKSFGCGLLMIRPCRREAP